MWSERLPWRCEAGADGDRIRLWRRVMNPSWRNQASGAIKTKPHRQGAVNDDRADWREAVVTVSRVTLPYVWHGRAAMLRPWPKASRVNSFQHPLANYLGEDRGFGC